MGIRASKPAIDLREELASLKNPIRYTQQQFWFVGDGSAVHFELPAGWKPLHVFNAGSLQKEGNGDEYTVSSVQGVYKITFNVAPTDLNDIGVIGVYA